MSGRRRDDSSGQALVEFALIAPLLFLILFGIIQLGFVLGGQNGLTNAAREAARYASTLPTPDTTVGCTGTGNNSAAVQTRLTTINLRQYIPGYIPGNVVNPGSGPATCNAAALGGTATGVAYCARANGDGTFSIRVRVSVVYRHPLFIPLVGRFFSPTNTWQLGAVEEMRVEGPNRTTNGGFTLCPP